MNRLTLVGGYGSSASGPLVPFLIPIECSTEFANALADKAYDVQVIPFDGRQVWPPAALLLSNINEISNPSSVRAVGPGCGENWKPIYQPTRELAEKDVACGGDAASAGSWQPRRTVHA